MACLNCRSVGLGGFLLAAWWVAELVSVFGAAGLLADLVESAFSH